MKMESFVKLSEFDIKINRDTAFSLIDLFPNNPVYDEVISEYDEIEDKVMQLVKPKAYFKLGKLSKEVSNHINEGIPCDTDIPVIFCLITLGDEINDLCNQYFKEGDYLLGMLVNAMSDAYLFQMEDILKEKIIGFCANKRYGIAKRLDAPVNIPMSVQKDILDEIKKEENIPIEVTTGYMYTTIKTIGYLLILTSEEDGIKYKGHNCNSCNAINCKLRKVEKEDL